MYSIKKDVGIVLVGSLFLACVLWHIMALPVWTSVSCSADISDKTIGIEYVSTTCNENTSDERIYIQTGISCRSNTVQAYAPLGDGQYTPGYLVYFLKARGYRVFGDEYGNHIIGVHSNFGSSSLDSIDGIQLSNYLPGHFYQGVFEKILEQRDVPVDADKDHYTRCGNLDCDDSDPAITTTCVVIPPEKIDHGRPPCPMPRPQLVGDPINIINGNIYQEELDLHMGNLFIKRTYNSRSTDKGFLGYGWRLGWLNTSLDPDFEIEDSLYVEITDQTGRGVYFFNQDESTFISAFNEKSNLMRNGSDYVWQRQDGSEFVFDQSGRLKRLRRPKGGSVTITYDDALPVNVRDDTTGRELNLTYNEKRLVSTIQGPVTPAVPDGIMVSYGYDQNDNLISVTYADGSGFDYQYDDSNDIHNLTGKRDKAGHTLATWP